MGANAQTAVPAFVAGEVLTAAEMTQVNTGIPVFATTTTRDAAFGGAGEKVLAEGQYAYIEATNTTQYYDGAAWQSLVSNPGLVAVRSETAFTAVSTITADSVFSSTYTNYLIQFSATQTVGSALFYMQFRTSGATNTTANYAWQHNYITSALTAARTSSGATSMTMTADLGAGGQAGSITVYNPNLPENTQMSHTLTITSGSSVTQLGVGGFGTTTVFDGFLLGVTTGSMTGKYSIYGYNRTA